MFKFVILSTLLLVVSVSQAAELGELREISLEDLLNIDISVSTKQEIPLKLSPAKVTVHTAESIREKGIHQLADLADITSGYSSYSIFGERVFETRGQKAQSFENNKHLVLLDDIVINHARANKAPIENELALYTLNQVEMLSGPASSLYGQSAFYGVVNLSSALSEDNQTFAHMNYEVEQGAWRLVANTNVHTQLGHSYLAFSRFQKPSGDQFVGPEFSPLQLYYDDQDARFIYGRQQYESKSFGEFTIGYINLNRVSGLGEHWQGDFSTPENEIEWSTQIGFLNWEEQFGDNWGASIKLTENESDERGIATSFNRALAIKRHPILFDLYLVEVQSRQIEAELNWQMNEDSSLRLGLSTESRKDTGGYFVSEVDISQVINPSIYISRTPSEKLRYDGAYIQYYDVLTWFGNTNLTLGLRFDSGKYLNDEFEQLSPRLALVKQLSPKWTIKASYSTALRSPGLKEYLLNEETRELLLESAANPEKAISSLPDSLDAETFISYEFSALYQTPKWLVKFNTFYDQTENALNGLPVTFTNRSGDLVTRNSFSNSSAKQSVKGYEIELDWFFGKHWLVNTNFSQVEALEKQDSKIVDIPKLKALISLTGDFSWGNITLSNSFYSDFEGDVGSIKQTNFTITENTTEKLNWQIKVRNVFNEKNYYSASAKAGVPKPSRTLEIGFSYLF